MMLSSDASCSDCKLELLRNKWSKLLLKWINRCVNEKNQKIRVRRLSPNCLSYIMTKYSNDVCDDDIDRAMLFTDDIEPFIKYKYPSLRLRHLVEEQDVPKKLYIMTSVLLYHCCVKSQTGLVHDDIYQHLNKPEQELILKYCERLSDMEPTINNVELAIQDAFESMVDKDDLQSQKMSNTDLDTNKSSDTLAHMSSSSPSKCSGATLPSDCTLVGDSPSSSPKFPPLKFTSSITVLPSVVTDTSTYSDIMILDDSEKSAAERDNFVDSDDVSTYVEPRSKRDSKRDEEHQKVERDKINQRFQKEYDRKRYNVERIASRLTFETDMDSSVERNDKIDNDPIKTEKPIDQDNDIQAAPSTITDSKNPRCLSECSCTKCSPTGPCCGDPGSTMGACKCSVPEKPPHQDSNKQGRNRINKKITAIIFAIVLFLILTAALTALIPLYKAKKQPKKILRVQRVAEGRLLEQYAWKCKNKLCQKVYQPTDEKIYPSQSICTLICMGPQIWPHPIGRTNYGSKIIALSTNKLEYKLDTVSSDAVNGHLAQAFKLFIGDLVKLEKTGLKFRAKAINFDVKKMSIKIEVDSDPDPRLRINTEEAYQLKIDTVGKQAHIKISSSSFCGVRHGLETLSQMILLDESTGYLITLSKADIKDAPSYKYRGLMIDTARNYIPVKDIMRTVDAMATVKLNTFHWRISDATSFPLLLHKVPQLFEYGGYDRSMVYTKDDVKTVVKRAGVRGIRVLIEVAAPGPVGRPWLWSPGASCLMKNNDTCDNVLCVSLDSRDSVLNVLQTLYEEILEMTQVDDVFHLSNGAFSFSNCFNVMHNRNGFLDKILDRLKRANKGFLPKLPIIWYTPQLANDFESKTWERYGVQLNDWVSSPVDNFLSKFKVIHSSKWDLSCEIKKQRCKRYRNWQEMYSWKSWSNVEAFTVEGGEATLWTDLVHSGNLDYHLWPRTAAVAERLWSDIVANTTADGYVYVRLNSHRLRMLHDGIKGQAIWPEWCTNNPGPCMEKIHQKS